MRRAAASAEEKRQTADLLYGGRGRGAKAPAKKTKSPATKPAPAPAPSVRLPPLPPRRSPSPSSSSSASSSPAHDPPPPAHSNPVLEMAYRSIDQRQQQRAPPPPASEAAASQKTPAPPPPQQQPAAAGAPALEALVQKAVEKAREAHAARVEAARKGEQDALARLKRAGVVLERARLAIPNAEQAVHDPTEGKDPAAAAENLETLKVMVENAEDGLAKARAAHDKARRELAEAEAMQEKAGRDAGAEKRRLLAEEAERARRAEEERQRKEREERERKEREERESKERAEREVRERKEREEREERERQRQKRAAELAQQVADLTSVPSFASAVDAVVAKRTEPIVHQLDRLFGQLSDIASKLGVRGAEALAAAPAADDDDAAAAAAAKKRKEPAEASAAAAAAPAKKYGKRQSADGDKFSQLVTQSAAAADDFSGPHEADRTVKPASEDEPDASQGTDPQEEEEEPDEKVAAVRKQIKEEADACRAFYEENYDAKTGEPKREGFKATVARKEAGIQPAVWHRGSRFFALIDAYAAEPGVEDPLNSVLRPTTLKEMCYLAWSFDDLESDAERRRFVRHFSSRRRIAELADERRLKEMELKSPGGRPRKETIALMSKKKEEEDEDDGEEDEDDEEEDGSKEEDRSEEEEEEAEDPTVSDLKRVAKEIYPDTDCGEALAGAMQEDRALWAALSKRDAGAAARWLREADGKVAAACARLAEARVAGKKVLDDERSVTRRLSDGSQLGGSARASWSDEQLASILRRRGHRPFEKAEEAHRSAMSAVTLMANVSLVLPHLFPAAADEALRLQAKQFHSKHFKQLDDELERSGSLYHSAAAAPAGKVNGAK